MDYLQEVLERQETLLQRLLTGERRTEPMEQEAHREAQGGSAGSEREGGSRSHEPMLQAERRGAARAAWREDRPQTGEEAEMDRTLEAQAETFQQTRWADSLWRTPPALYAASLPVSGGATELAALSRAVQRDARRYDGGFTMY